MSTKWQALLLAMIILGSVAIVNIGRDFSFGSRGEAREKPGIELKTDPDSSFYKASLLTNDVVEIKKAPTRNWEVSDPKVSAEAVLIQSLDDYFPFYHYNTYYTWPTASLAKLVTVLVVLEDIGGDKKIGVTKTAIATEGTAGNLRDGEIYSAEDLLKIMLLTSSNDAAAAFEEYFGGRDKFVARMNAKAKEIGMSRSVFYDAAGLIDENQSTANDLLRLIRYILLKHPEVFNWTRTPSFLVQAINGTDSRIVENINPLVMNSSFLGGKTGTSEESRENLVSIFSFNNKRVAVIILGSRNRVAEVEALLRWMGEAYNFDN